MNSDQEHSSPQAAKSKTEVISPGSSFQIPAIRFRETSHASHFHYIRASQSVHLIKKENVFLMDVGGMIEEDEVIYKEFVFSQGPRMRKGSEEPGSPQKTGQKKSPDLRGSWDVPGALVYLETEKLLFAVAVWLPLAALAVS
jgi:hypothetical protein